MTDAEKLALVRKALGFDSALDAHDNRSGALTDIDHDLAEGLEVNKVWRRTLGRVHTQLREARKILSQP
jgi:hypothetical protein